MTASGQQPDLMKKIIAGCFKQVELSRGQFQRCCAMKRTRKIFEKKKCENTVSLYAMIQKKLNVYAS